MSTHQDSMLFSPAKIGDIEVANRIVMAPLTRSRAGVDGVHTRLAIDYYAQRASAGLIITEATTISRQARGYAFTPGIYAAAHIAAWKAVTEAVHRAGGKIVCQLWHVGRMSHVSLQAGGVAPVAPSAIRAADVVFLESGTRVPPSMPRALEIGEIQGIVADYEHAARCAMAAGFDGIEVHSANCFLLEQFIRDSTNVRTDRYGGSVENRTRFPIEVITAVSKVWGAGRVGVRLSPLTRFAGDTALDSDPQGTYGFYVERLGALGLAYLHCIEGQTRGANAADAFDFEALHAAYGGKYIANNSYTRELAMNAISSGHADMVSFGRPFIGNPDLVERIRVNAALTEPDHETFYGGGAQGYTDYQTLG